MTPTAEPVMMESPHSRIEAWYQHAFDLVKLQWYPLTRDAAIARAREAEYLRRLAGVAS